MRLTKKSKLNSSVERVKLEKRKRISSAGCTWHKEENNDAS